MFEDVLKGTKTGKSKGKAWRTFGNKDANKWKKQGNVKSMFRTTKKVKW